MSGYSQVVVYRCPVCHQMYESQSDVDSCLQRCDEYGAKKQWLSAFSLRMDQIVGTRAMSLKRAWVKMLNEVGLRHAVSIRKKVVASEAGDQVVPYLRIRDNEPLLRWRGYGADMNEKAVLVVQFLIHTDPSQFVELTVPSTQDAAKTVVIRVYAGDLVAEAQPWVTPLSTSAGIFDFTYEVEYGNRYRSRFSKELSAFFTNLADRAKEIFLAEYAKLNSAYTALARDAGVMQLCQNITSMDYQIDSLERQLAILRDQRSTLGVSLSQVLSTEKPRILAEAFQNIENQLTEFPLEINAELTTLAEQQVPLYFSRQGGLHQRTF